MKKNIENSHRLTQDKHRQKWVSFIVCVKSVSVCDKNKNE